MNFAMWRLRGALLTAFLPFILAGCATQEYTKPALDMPAGWKVEAPWRVGQPSDTAPKGPWWQRFGDAELDALEQRAMANSCLLYTSDAADE